MPARDRAAGSPGHTAVAASATASRGKETHSLASGGPWTIGCRFEPTNIVSDRGSISIGVVNVVGVNEQGTTGGVPVTLRGTGGNTVLLTSSPQTTSKGIAQFTVMSISATANGTDTYTATATVSGRSMSATCTIVTSDTLGAF